MAARTQTAPDLASLLARIEQQETRLAELERIVTVQVLLQTRDVVKRPGLPADYRQIMTAEQQLATHDDVDVIVAWLTQHHGG